MYFNEKRRPFCILAWGASKQFPKILKKFPIIHNHIWHILYLLPFEIIDFFSDVFRSTLINRLIIKSKKRFVHYVYEMVRGCSSAVERSLCMRKAPGSKPGISNRFKNVDAFCKGNFCDLWLHRLQQCLLYGRSRAMSL